MRSKKTISELRMLVRKILAEAAEEGEHMSRVGKHRHKRRSLSGSHPDEGYQPATAEKMFLDAKSGGYEEESKENVLRFLRGLGLLPSD